MQRIGFLSFGHWGPGQGSRTRTAGEALRQGIELAVAADRAQAAAELAELPELGRKARAAGKVEGFAQGRAEAHAELVLERTELAQKSEAVQIAAQAARDELEAEVLRLKSFPADFDRFLDTPMPNGKTFRPVFERSVGANQTKRGERARSVIQGHTPVFATSEHANDAGPSLG